MTKLVEFEGDMIRLTPEGEKLAEDVRAGRVIIDDFFDKAIQNMLDHGLIERVGEDFQLTPKGKHVYHELMKGGYTLSGQNRMTLISLAAHARTRHRHEPQLTTEPSGSKGIASRQGGKSAAGQSSKEARTHQAHIGVTLKHLTPAEHAVECAANMKLADVMAIHDQLELCDAIKRDDDNIKISEPKKPAKSGGWMDPLKDGHWD